MQFPSARSAALLVICIAIPLVIGFIGSFFTMPEIAGWYAGLQKPAFNPPAWIFGPVWTCLYVLMGISLWLVIKDGIDSQTVQQAVVLFAAQLAANLAWSILFFGMHLIIAAFLEIIVLFVLIAATTLAFRRINTTAAWFLVPYLCWTAFASVLTGTVWLLN
ncbi:MAG: tryptophan-rich sensory protein [Methanoregula sp.]|nr:tryptophan-rich sensory protein [Methanoregula sp.]